MRIAQISTCWIPTPPPTYGGTELVVANLTDELVDRGHDVTLFAPGDSRTRAELVSYYDTSLGTERLVSQPNAELLHVLHAYGRVEGFDIVHDHTYPFGPAIGSHLPTGNVVHTLHVPFDAQVRPLYELVGGRLHNVAISDYQRRSMPAIPYAATIHHGIDVASYPFRADKDDYLLFLGRMSPDKGAHTAVEVAARLGRRLVMVTKMAEPAEKEYFESRVRPAMTSPVEIVSDLSLAEKGAMFAGASCFLMAIEWHEPFGLVMIESLACGTPVVGLRRGSVPEIVDHGVTGFVADSLEEFVAGVARSDTIDPAACRAAAEARFTIATMTDRYEELYEQVRSGSPG